MTSEIESAQRGQRFMCEPTASRAIGPSYLQVFFVVVVHDGQEDGHEDVGVDEDVEDEEDGEEEAGVVCRHPDNEKQKVKRCR